MQDGPETTGSVGAGPLWAQVYTGDLQHLAEGLKADRFRHREIVSIVNTLFEERNSVRRLALTDESEEVSYWRAPISNPQLSERQVRYQRLFEADMTVLRRLMSSEEYLREDPQHLERLSQRFGDLSEEKIKHLLRIDNDYAELTQRMYSSNEHSGDALLERINLLTHEHERDMHAVLTAQEYEQYKLRNSSTARSLRFQLDHFQPSKQEFISLHNLHEAVRSQFPQLVTNEETMHAQRRAMEALAPQIEAALGPERYADYQQTLQDSSRRVNNLLVRLDLPLRTGAQFDEWRKDYTQKAEAVRNDAQLPPAERDARLNALAQEARQRIGQTLGSHDAVAAYEDIKGWIRDLQPKP